jgi:hypothetical protein
MTTVILQSYFSSGRLLNTLLAFSSIILHPAGPEMRVILFQQGYWGSNK